jgi:outer membrane protein assembly factor BamB
MRRVGARVVLAVALLAPAGCTSTPRPAPPPAPASAPDAPTGSPTPTGDEDWPTYHHDNARTGVAPGLAPLGTLSRAWQATLDGAVYGQPLVVGDRVFAATEHDTVYALDAATGAVVWSQHVGEPVPRSKLPCGNIDPLGITGTMVYDKATRLLFALAETTGGAHTLVSLDAATGAVRERRAAEPPKGDRIAHQQRSALIVVGQRVYISYGGLFGDCGQYFGSVVSLPVTGAAAPVTYAVPTSREAGMWAPGGASATADKLYYSVGNGESTRGYDDSDSVLAFTPDLKRVDLFAPGNWADDNAKDLDLGSMSPALVGPYVFIAGKRGTGYTMRADHLGGVGGQVSQAQVCRAYGGAAVAGDTVYVPCSDGPRAVVVDGSGTISVRWRGPSGAKGSPVVGGGAVWVVDYDGGVLYALDPASGMPRQQLPIGRCPHFASPTLSRGRAFVGTTTGVVAVAGA